MKVEAVKSYNDKERVNVNKGDTFDVSTERGMELLNAGACKIISVSENNIDDELIQANKKAKERVTELEKIAKQQKEYIAALERSVDISEYAYMSDAQLATVAKEKGIDGRIKDRKVIVDTLMKKTEE